MKKILSLFVLAVLMLASCSKYDDTDLKNRVAALEALASYKTLLQKLDAGQTVTSYSKTGDNATLTFSDGTTLVINQKEEPELFQSVNADGNTLTITLADGTVVPISYGEKEPYTFTVGDGVRKCYSFWETEETYKSGVMKIPYTLTGDLSSPDDVTILANVTSFAEEYIPIKDFYSIEKVDAKSGYLVVNRLHEKAKLASDEELTLHFPGGILDLTAYFPDGSIRTYSIKVLSEAISLYAWDTCFDVDYNAPVTVGDQFYALTVPLNVSKDAGNFEFWCYEFVSDYDFEDYDGAPIDESAYENRIWMSIVTPSVGGMKMSSSPRVQEIGTWQYDTHKKHYRGQSIPLSYQANNSGTQLVAYLGFYIEGLSLYSVKLTQSK